MSKKRANIHPGLIGELFTDGTDYYKLIDCQSEPSATIERIRDVGITITKPISAFANLVLMKPVRPIVKPPVPRKVRSDVGKPRERKEKAETVTVITPELRDIDYGNLTFPLSAVAISRLRKVEMDVPSVLRERKSKAKHTQKDEVPEIADKKGEYLTIHVPTGMSDDTEYMVNIAGSEASGPTLRLTVLAALEEWSGKIPGVLTEQERQTIQGILDASDTP